MIRINRDRRFFCLGGSGTCDLDRVESRRQVGHHAVASVCSEHYTILDRNVVSRSPLLSSISLLQLTSGGIDSGTRR